MTDVDTNPYEAQAAPAENACPECGATFDGKMRLGLHRRKEHGVLGKNASKTPRPPGRPRKDGQPPKERAPKLGDDTEKAPRVARQRLDKVGTWLWRAVGKACESAQFPAAGRCCHLQAEAVGPVFEKAVKGTVADRLLQPVARTLESTSELGSFVGLPVAAEAFRAKPSPMTQMALVEALELNLPYIAKSLKDAKRRQERLEADLADLAHEFGKPDGASISLQEVGNWVLFGDIGGPPPERPDGDHYNGAADGDMERRGAHFA